MHNQLITAAVLLSLSFCSQAQQRPKMDFEEYEPASTLVVPEHKTTRAKFPFIDIHNHQFNMPTTDLGTLIKEMDKLNMAIMVNLSGDSGEKIRQSVKNISEHYPNRFIVFANVDWSGVGNPGWAEKSSRPTGAGCKEWCERFESVQEPGLLRER
jgi:hypothetical protein